MMQWYSPNITQPPFTSPGTGQHVICWFYTYKNNLCLFVTQQTVSGKRGSKKESGGEVNLLIPKSSNMPSLNRLKSKHAKGQRGRDNQKIPLSFYTTQEYQNQDALFHPRPFPPLSQALMLGFVVSRPTREVVSKP